MSHLPQENKVLTQNIAQIIEQARKQVKQTVNFTMVQCYWNIGRLLVEDEQQGEARAEYGKYVLKNLSEYLTATYGKGFDISNLRNMRQFYLAFPIQDALRTELSWTHYRRLSRIEDPKARAWYLQEAIEQNWSSRALDRQISVLYYERLLASQNKLAVIQEAEENTVPLKEMVQDYLRDPIHRLTK